MTDFSAAFSWIFSTAKRFFDIEFFGLGFTLWQLFLTVFFLGILIFVLRKLLSK